MSTVTDTASSIPVGPEETSRGSSVSSGFINEYEQILKFAIVAPKLQIGGDGFIDINKGVAKKNNASLDSSSSVSSTSSPSSSASSPAPFETGRTISDGSLEIKVLEARQAVEEQFKPKIDKRSRHVIVPNAMDTLLETPKESNRSVRKVLDSSASSSPESLAGEIPSPSVDKDLIRMDAAMEDWCLQLKRNVLNELADMKKKQILYQEQAIDQIKSKHSAEVLHSTHEVESMKELLYTFEQSVKQKDQVITNLTDVLNKQKQRSEKIRLFSVWRLKHNDEQRQGFAVKMAEKFYKRALLTKVWIAWRSVVENTWKRRVEKACQIKSQEICLRLTEDYEERLQALQQELAGTRAEIAKMHTERDGYEENMKKAFMRGVCALNMEAMSMFREGQQDPDQEAESNTLEPQNSMGPCAYGNSTNEDFTTTTAENCEPFQDSSRHAQPHQQEPATSCSKKKVHFDSLETANKNKNGIPNNKNPRSGLNAQRKNIHVKMTGKKDYGTLKKTGGSQPSTVSSIKVERHMQPRQRLSQHPLRPSSRSSQPDSRSTTPNMMLMTKKPTSTSVIVD